MKGRFFLAAFGLSACVAGAGLLGGCGIEASEDDGRPDIICTLFPQYDFARQIYGEQADVTMLLKPGMESHMYDPTPEDMKKISEADVFIYTGAEMEPWAAQIIEGLDDSVTVLDLSEYVTLESEEEHEHEHEHEHSIFERAHEHSYDPHYWLDLSNAAAMAEAVAELSESLDIEDKAQVQRNCEAYVSELTALDDEFMAAVSAAKDKDIVFAGRFAYGYFIDRYNLNYETVYQSCSAEADPGVGDMVRVIDHIREHGTKIVFYEELSSARAAKTIAEDTGVEICEFSTAHNVSKADFDAKVTFIDVMERNLSALKRALDV